MDWLEELMETKVLTFLYRNLGNELCNVVSLLGKKPSYFEENRGKEKKSSIARGIVGEGSVQN